MKREREVGESMGASKADSEEEAGRGKDSGSEGAGAGGEGGEGGEEGGVMAEGEKGRKDVDGEDMSRSTGPTDDEKRLITTAAESRQRKEEMREHRRSERE